MGEEIQNRTFLMPNKPVKLSMATPPRVNFPAHNNGGAVHPGGFPAVGQADPAFSQANARQPYMRSFAGYRWVGNNLVPETVQEWAGQRFANYATPWEKQWSVLINSAFRMAPMVDDSGLVVAHIGTVSTGNIATFQMPPPAGKTQYLMTSAIIRTFGMTTTGFSDSSVTVMTTPDGQVLTRIGPTTTRGVEPVDVSPLDIFFAAKALVDLGSAGLRLITVLQKRAAARSVLKGVDKELLAKLTGEAARAERNTAKLVPGVYTTKRGITFEVSKVGNSIPGTNVPESLVIKVGRRVFNVSRNASGSNAAFSEIGPVTKHLAEDALKRAREWSKDIKVDISDGELQILDAAKRAAGGASLRPAEFPISSLAGALKEAETQILNGKVPPRINPRTGGPSELFEYMVNVGEPGEIQWEIGIFTKGKPSIGWDWNVFHIEIKNPR